MANYRYSKKVKKTTNYKSKTKRQDKSEVVKAARVGWVGREGRKEEKRSHLLTFLSFPPPDIPTLQNTHFFFFSIFNLLFSKSQAFLFNIISSLLTYFVPTLLSKSLILCLLSTSQAYIYSTSKSSDFFCV